MNLKSLSRGRIIAVCGAMLLSLASCIKVNEELGQNFIPTDQKWDVFIPEAVDLQDVTIQMADSLSAYSNTRFTFGSVKDDILGDCIKSTTFTLLPLTDTLVFGDHIRIRQFHFSASRDTLSMIHDNQERMLQNVYVSELKTALDTTMMYVNAFSIPENREKYLDLSKRITNGIPIYDGGDSLTFDFSEEFALSMIERLKEIGPLDSMKRYMEKLPGIYITTDTPVSNGGRINMFELPLSTDSQGYLSGNYAELKVTADFGERKDVDTSYVFYFGPSEFIKRTDSGYPTQFAFNASEHGTGKKFVADWEAGQKELIYIEGGSGLKPVVKAKEIKAILEDEIGKAGIEDFSQVVINKATIIMPYNVNGDFARLEKYPMVLSPTS